MGENFGCLYINDLSDGFLKSRKIGSSCVWFARNLSGLRSLFLKTERAKRRKKKCLNRDHEE